MEVMYQQIVDESSHPMIVIHKSTLETVFANKKAVFLYGDLDSKVDIRRIFAITELNPAGYKTIVERLDEDSVAFHHCLSTTNQGESKQTRIQIGYASEDESLIFLHLSMPQDEAKGQAETQNIASYFNVIQNLSKDFFYRLDIENKILYRNEATAELYGIPAIVCDYPNRKALETVFHPEDMDRYIDFILGVMQGKEDSLTARMIAPSGNFEYHNISFKQLREPDGRVKEMIGNTVNVQELVEVEEKLADINEYFNILQSFSKDLIYRLDIKNRTLHRNEQTSKLYGIPTEVRNYPNRESLQKVIHPDDIEEYVQFIHRVLQGNAEVHTCRMTAPSGDYAYHRIRFKPLRQGDGSIKEMIGTAENIQALMELETKASYDSLTQCYNKLSFQEEVCAVLTAQSEQPHALLFLDMDEFKYVNDNLGHAFGDLVIKELGKRLRDEMGQGDFVGRVGGDEFVIFMKNISSDDIVLGKAKILLRSISEEICGSIHCHTMKGSIGIARYPEHGTCYEELYHHADLALYQSKNKGKNTATIYTP